MSEAVVVIAEDLGRKSDRAPWAAKDGNGETWKRWDQSWDPFVGKRLKLTYEIKSREWQGRTFEDNIVSEHELVTESENGDTPPLGTGQYVTGQKPPIEARRIFASTAANNATRLTEILIAHQTSREITPELVCEIWDGMVAHIFQDLIRRGYAFLETDEVPF